MRVIYHVYGVAIIEVLDGKNGNLEFSGQGLDERWRMRLQDVSRLFSAVRNVINTLFHERTLFFCQSVFYNEGPVQSVPPTGTQ
jgi:hypothetical protein